MKTQKYKMILLGILGICCLACSKDDKNTSNDPDRDQKYTSYYYYSYEAGNIINAATFGLKEGDFIPGPSCCKGDTLLIANVQQGQYSLELYNWKTRTHLASLREWTYKEAKQTFTNKIEAIAVSGDRLYLANMESCIDVFNLKNLEFETRIGNKAYGEGKAQMVHSHAMVVSGGYIVVRSKNRVLVYKESDVTAANYQKTSFFGRTKTDGFDTNNGFNSYQMVNDTTGLILLTDYGQYGNRKIQAIDPTRIVAGDNIEVVAADKSLTLEFNPKSIALHQDRMFISTNAGTIQIYDRTRTEFVQSFNTVKGYQFKNPEKIVAYGNTLWISDPGTNQLVEVNIYKNEIREYEKISKNLIRLISTRTANSQGTLINIETHEVVTAE